MFQQNFRDFQTKMQIARVIGNIVSTVKNEALASRKLLLVQTLDADLQPKGKPLMR